jgi:outer membrane receptor protein involved in Fe transport
MRILLFFGISLFFGGAWASSSPLSEFSPSVKGKVVDMNQKAVPYASVLLFSSLDSTVVDGASTNDSGEFELRAPAGSYFLKIKFLSFKEKIIPGLILDTEDIDLGELKMEPNEKLLNEVTVEAERPEMELKLDKRVFNVQQDPSNAGQNAAEVLDNIPSVSVDADGNVTLRGSGNVRILIDGKPSTLVGLSGNDALRQIQGDMIERVEVITNPSARYDAEGEVGIINIVLKKKLDKGFNGSINARVGYPENFGGGFNLNLRQEKFNLFGGYGIGYRKSPGFGSVNQRYDGPDTVYSYTQESNHERGGLSHNIRGGVDFFLSKRTSLTLSGVYSISDGNNTSAITYSDYDLNGELSRTVTRDEFETDFSRRQEYNLNFRQTFKKPERLFTFDLKKNFSIDGEKSDLIELSSLSIDQDIYQRTNSDENEDSWLIQTDYIHPFGKEGKFETGARVSLRQIGNDFYLEDSLATGWEVNDLLNNDLRYTENIYAAYVMAGNKFKKFTYQLGLRGEYSDVSTELLKTNELNRRDYFQLFPSAHFAYEFKEKSFVQLSYSRRISRPRYWWLSPFFTFSDSRNFFSGNPDLNPEYTHSNELGYLKYWKKGSLLTSLYYRYITDDMERILLTDSVGFTRRVPVNLGNEHSFGFEFSGSYELTKWWDLIGNMNFYREISEGEYEGITYSNDTYAVSGRIRSKFRIKKKLNLQTSLQYNSPQSTNQGSSKARYSWNASMSLDCFKGNGTLSFNARDILNSRVRRNIVESQYFYSESEFQWRSRQFTLSFVYRINQKKGRDRSGSFGGNDDGGM